MSVLASQIVNIEAVALFVVAVIFSLYVIERS